MQTKYLFAVLLAALSFLSPVKASADAVDQLAFVAEEVNKTCPVDQGAGGVMKAVTFDKKTRTFAYHMDLNPAYIKKEPFLEMPESALKDNILSGLKDVSTRPLMQLLSDGKAGLLTIYSLNGEKLREILLTTADIDSILNDKTSDQDNARQFLAGSIAQEKATCPNRLDESLTMTDAYIVGDKMVYVYNVNTAYMTISQLKSVDAILRKNLLGMFKSDPTLKVIGRKAVLAGYSIQYLYVDPTSNETYSLTFTPEDLKNI